MRRRFAWVLPLLVASTALTTPTARTQESGTAAASAPQELRPVVGHAVRAGKSRPARAIRSSGPTRSRLEAGQEELEVPNPPLPRGEEGTLARLLVLERAIFDPVAQYFAP